MLWWKIFLCMEFVCVCMCKGQSCIMAINICNWITDSNNNHNIKGQSSSSNFVTFFVQFILTNAFEVLYFMEKSRIDPVKWLWFNSVSVIRIYLSVILPSILSITTCEWSLGRLGFLMLLKIQTIDLYQSVSLIIVYLSIASIPNTNLLKRGCLFQTIYEAKFFRWSHYKN